jgi:hypothetical protein
VVKVFEAIRKMVYDPTHRYHLSIKEIQRNSVNVTFPQNIRDLIVTKVQLVAKQRIDLVLDDDKSETVIQCFL